MKIRTGFVSNSSSSSFVVNAGNDLYNKANKALVDAGEKTGLVVTPKIIAKEMLLSLEERDDSLRRLSEVPDDAVYICFQSCNYDTEIFQYKEKILIETCNNNYSEWENVMNTLRKKYNVSIKSMSENCDEINLNEYVWDYDSGKKNKHCLHFDRERIDEELGPAHIIDKLTEYGD